MFRRVTHHPRDATSTRDDVTRLSEPGVSRCVRARVTKKVGWVWKVWVANGPIGSGKNVESSTAVEKPTNHPRAGAGGRVKRRRRSVCPSRARFDEMR